MRALPAMILIAATFATTVACNARGNGTPNAAASSDQTRTTAADTTADVRQVTIPIDGMSCGACAARLKQALKEIDGVVDAEVSLERANARVRYVPTRTTPEKLVAAIKALGFTPGAPSATTS